MIKSGIIIMCFIAIILLFANRNDNSNSGNNFGF